MSFRVLSGGRLNCIGRGASYGATPTASVAAFSGGGSLDAAYPLANVYDGVPASPIRWDSRAQQYGLDVATALLANGDMEQSSLVGWTALNATLTSETGAGNFLLGARSLKVVGAGVGVAGGAFQDVRVDAGQWLQIRAGLKSDGVNAASVRIQNVSSGNWLTSGGAWQAAETSALSRTANTMAALTPLAFQVESAATCGTTEPWLRVWVRAAVVAQTFYADEVLLCPGFDFVGIFGHGFPASWTLGTYKQANYWHGGAASAIWADVASFATRQSAHYLNAAVQYEPFVQLRLSGQQIGDAQPLPWLGEMVLGQTRTITNPDYPLSIEMREPQIRLQSAGGTQWVSSRGPGELRKVTMVLVYTTDAAYAAARDVIFRASRGGANPIILVPTETDSGEAIYGRIDDTVVWQRTVYNRRESGFVVTEEALPYIW